MFLFFIACHFGTEDIPASLSPLVFHDVSLSLGVQEQYK